jgi:hypothetical protein
MRPSAASPSKLWSGTGAKILDEQEVRLTQEQWFYLMTLGGKQLA